MPPTTQPNAIPPSLTDKDTRLLALAFLCSDSPKVRSLPLSPVLSPELALLTQRRNNNR